MAELSHRQRRAIEALLTSKSTAEANSRCVSNWMRSGTAARTRREEAERHAAVFDRGHDHAHVNVSAHPTAAWVIQQRELLDHVIVFNEEHLRRLLREFVAYYHDDRTHLALGKDPPMPRPASRRRSTTAEVIASPRLGGLHHRYAWAEAA